MRLTRKTIEKRVAKILSETLNCPVQRIRGESRLVDDLGINSFTMIRIVYVIEESFSLRIDPESISAIRTVDDIVAHIFRQSQRAA